MEENEFELVVGDMTVSVWTNGIRWAAVDPLGSGVVHAFIKMLHGRIEIDAHAGTTVSIRFNEFGKQTATET